MEELKLIRQVGSPKDNYASKKEQPSLVRATVLDWRRPEPSHPKPEFAIYKVALNLLSSK